MADDRIYASTVEPEAGGEVRVAVDGWGGWNVWVDVVGYHDVGSSADAALEPRTALGVARRLVVAAVVCWWRRKRGAR
ncbi:hypothetical protein JOF41_007304 [Saccharothrix coeruleofusca]|uniref:hypothetical protein n=1 Tax=Saccharothrix coeruleofusca TaxID=33919 RepID=UPI001AEA0FB6|nr:hypothetical protein [Saccharothrix coeruleofusca]MBP2341050.1 hypothetical protein [Saccharothrix coeruleofusca]